MQVLRSAWLSRPFRPRPALEDDQQPQAWRFTDRCALSSSIWNDRLTGSYDFRLSR